MWVVGIKLAKLVVLHDDSFQLLHPLVYDEGFGLESESSKLVAYHIGNNVLTASIKTISHTNPTILRFHQTPSPPTPPPTKKKKTTYTSKQSHESHIESLDLPDLFKKFPTFGRKKYSYTIAHLGVGNHNAPFK